MSLLSFSWHEHPFKISKLSTRYQTTSLSQYSSNLKKKTVNYLLKKIKIRHVSVRAIGGFSLAIFRASYSSDNRRDRDHTGRDFRNYLNRLYQYYTGLPQEASKYRSKYNEKIPVINVPQIMQYSERYSRSFRRFLTAYITFPYI